MVSQEELAKHGLHVAAFVEGGSGRLVSGPDMKFVPRSPEDSPYTPSSKALRKLDAQAWRNAALDLYNATDGALSLAFMPANETEWQVQEGFAAYRLAGEKAKRGLATT